MTSRFEGPPIVVVDYVQPRVARNIHETAAAELSKWPKTPSRDRAVRLVRDAEAGTTGTTIVENTIVEAAREAKGYALSRLVTRQGLHSRNSVGTFVDQPYFNWHRQ